MTEKCKDWSPPWFKGSWRDWHRGHACNLDDGTPRSKAGKQEIEAGQTARRGCDCTCCAHGEGSDCACTCHAEGKCSAVDPRRV